MKLRDFLNIYNSRRSTIETPEDVGLWHSHNVLPIRVCTMDFIGSNHYFEFANSDWGYDKDLDTILNLDILNREIESFRVAQCPGIEDFIEVTLKLPDEKEKEENGSDDGTQQN